MTKDEFLADLLLDVANPVALVAEPQKTSPPDPTTSNQALVSAIEAGTTSGLGTVTFWQTAVMEIGPIGIVQDPKQFRFKVFNLGVDGLETVVPTQVLENPKRDMVTAVTYLEAERKKGTWFRYVEEQGGIKRSDLDFFTATVFEKQSDGTLKERRIMVSYDSDDVATHDYIA